MNQSQQKQHRIWRDPASGPLQYYNFKSKKDLPTPGCQGAIAVVNHRHVIWNHYTNRWNYASVSKEDKKR